MDKLIEVPWVLKIIALFLAGLLFISINFEPNTETLGINTPAQSDSEVVESVPVEVYYDRDNLVVSGVPETVDVTLTGPKNLVITAKNQREFKVYIDLSDPEITLGDRTISMKIRDLNEKISYTIDPATIDISIQEKVTEEFSVEPEFDRSLLDEGYIAEEPKVSPGTVEITGAKDVVAEIAYVKAIIDIEEGSQDTIYREAQVQALDKNLNKLDVTIEPSVVTVEVPIVSPSKTVSIKPIASGTPKDGTEVVSLVSDTKEATIYGKQSVLDNIDEIQVPIDVSKLEKSTELTVELDLPDGVTSASVQKVTVNVTVEETEEPTSEEEETTEEEETASKSFSDIAIEPIGLGEEFELVFLEPSQGSVDVVVTGTQNTLSDISASDISISMNVNGLEEGEHSAALKLTVPSTVKGELLSTSASFLIEKMKMDESEDIETDTDTS